jgi:hypothetical protein
VYEMYIKDKEQGQIRWMGRQHRIEWNGKVQSTNVKVWLFYTSYDDLYIYD